MAVAEVIRMGRSRSWVPRMTARRRRLPLAMELIDVVHQDDGIADHNAGQGQGPHIDRGADRKTGQPQGRHHTHQGQGHRAHDDQGGAEGFKQGRHDHIDKDEGQGQGEKNFPTGFLKFLKAMSQPDFITGRNRGGSE
jgi:hypothetical protein